MKQFLIFLATTTITIVFLYNSHWFTSYIYYTYCNNLALGSPPCNYLLELIYLASSGVKSIWLHLGTLVAGLFVYGFNRILSELGIINERLKVTEAEISKNRLHKS
jgi:hypothetical protein